MRRRPACLFFSAFIGLIILLYVLGIPLIPGPGMREEEYAGFTVRGRVESCEETGTGSMLVLGGTAAGRVRISVKEMADYAVGTPLAAKGTLRRGRKPQNPGGFDEELFLKVRGIFYTMTDPELIPWKDAPKRSFPGRIRDGMLEFLRRNRQKLTGRIRSVFPDPEAEIVCAMITGERAGIDDDMKDLWRTGGIMHMLAISGLHLSILCMCLREILQRAGAGFHLSLLIPLLFMTVYTLFTGASPSAVRAFLMFSIASAARLCGRTYDPPSALSAAGAAMLAGNPYYLFYSGFQLSFAAAFFCILYRSRGKRMTAVVLFLGTLPLVLRTCSEIPVLSVPVNLIALPALPALLACGIAGTVFGGPAAFPLVMMLKGLEALLRFCASIPHSSVIAGSPSVTRCLVYYTAFGIFACVMTKWRLYKRRLLVYAAVPFLVLILCIRIRTGLEISFLSVGQGDGIVIEMADGVNVMIDGGSSSTGEVGKYVLLPFLKARAISRIDYLFVTHSDEDHISGIREILADDSVKIGTLVMPRTARDDTMTALALSAEKRGARILYAASGDSFRMGDAYLEVMGPDARIEEQGDDANENCLVLALGYREFDALFTGDICGKGEEMLIERLASSARKYELVKISHHGSRTSTPSEFLEVTGPQAAVISCGRKNLYGHPHEEVLQRLKNTGCRIFRTDRGGAVLVSTDGRKYTVRSYAPAAVR